MIQASPGKQPEALQEERISESPENRVDLVEMLMKKFEALEKEVMRQNNHLASSFTSHLVSKKGQSSLAALANNFEDAKRQHQDQLRISAGAELNND